MTMIRSSALPDKGQDSSVVAEAFLILELFGASTNRTVAMLSRGNDMA